MDARPRPNPVVLAAALLGLLLLAPRPASADRLVIKYPGMRPHYGFEAEPHALVGPFKLPGDAGRGAGVGFRGTIELVENGFIKSINDSVGIGFGGDFLFAKDTAVWIPVVMQWNFWLSRSWSVFGEPGGGFYLAGAKGFRPTLSGGGRWHFADGMALTMRVGHPTFSIGVSFFL